MVIRHGWELGTILEGCVVQSRVVKTRECLLVYELIVELLLLRCGLCSSYRALEGLDGGRCGIRVLGVVRSNCGWWSCGGDGVRD
jgi:hypothetical protein